MRLLIASIGAILLVQTLIDLSFATPYKDCGTTGLNVTVFNISDCDTLPCDFKQGTNVSLNLNFTTTKGYKSLTNEVIGIIAGVKIPFPLPEPDACKCGVDCPVEPNLAYSESFSIPVLAEYPQISAYVQFQINDDSSNMIMCALFPIRITH